jgi:predicted DNA-binding transcriptional regulator AlpA
MKTTSPPFPPDFTLRYVGRKEAACVIGFSLRTLDRLASNDRTFPKARRIRKRRRWLLQELLTWMDEQSS